MGIVLAQLVLFASTSFVVNFHLCENYIQSFSLLGKAKTCKTMSCDESKTSVATFMKKSCCSDKQIKSTTQKFHKSQNLEISKINFVVNFVSQQDDISILKYNLKKDCFIGYSPPLQTFNFNDLYQVYLI